MVLAILTKLNSRNRFQCAETTTTNDEPNVELEGHATVTQSHELE